MTTPNPRRRFFRYSLRTLMIVVTVFCVWLGITAKRARDQRQAVEVILKLGGEVYYEHQLQKMLEVINRNKGRPGSQDTNTPGPVWLRRLIGDEYFFSVASVVFTGPKVNDTNLAAVGRLTNVHLLNLSGTNVGDDGMAHLEGLTNLQSLLLDSTQITDTGLLHLKELSKLGFLDFRNTKITDAGLEHLKWFTQLKRLYLTNTKVTDAGLEYLNGFTNLRQLYLTNTQVTEEGVEKLQQTLPNCNIINIIPLAQ